MRRRGLSIRIRRWVSCFEDEEERSKRPASERSLASTISLAHQTCRTKNAKFHRRKSQRRRTSIPHRLVYWPVSASEQESLHSQQQHKNKQHTSMSTDDSNAFSRLPFPTNAECNETTPVTTDKILLAALYFVGPGFAFGKLCEASL